ncbi:MAG: alpha/beta hydrolase domain-containing protein, partial [Acidobacteriota bacterium]
ISQSGRLLRTFVYEGFNADEQGKQVFEGVWAHAAGGGHGDFNQRFANPGRTTGQYSGVGFPTDQAPFTPEGLLAKATQAGVAPKLYLTNGSHEYWGRAAGLNHMTEDATKDVEPPANVRFFYVAGTQHGGGGGGANPNVQNLTNSMEVTFFLRASMVSLNAWITNNTAPPASQFPRIAKGQLISWSKLNFPKIPEFAVVKTAYEPRKLDFGPQFAAKGIISMEPAKVVKAYPILVPGIDVDGNETSGVRLPELKFPLATYAGWNLRHPNVGSPEQQYPLIGSEIRFARTKADREKSGDPRMSIGERYSGKQEYLGKIEGAAKELAGQRFLLDRDVAGVVALAGRHWDQAMGGK